MKRYLYILALGVLFSFTSCVQEDITVGNGSYYPSSNSGIQIIGASEDFDVKQVGTRANDNGVSDSFISEMTMLIFKANGDMLTAYNANQEKLASSHINIRRSNPTFLIETSKYEGTGILASMEAGMTIKYYDNTASDIGACSIYIVANAYHLIGERLEAGEITTLAALNEALLDTNANLNMPYNEQTGEYIGLPMIGCARDEETGNLATFDLAHHDGESNNNAVATIPLKKLYSKVCFSIQVNSKQLVTGQIPEFRLDDVEVFNVPSQVRMSYLEGDYITNLGDNYLYRYVNDTQKTSFSFAQKEMMPSDVLCRHSSSEDTDDVIKFHFYMPEHKVTPYADETTYSYPANLPIDNRQYFKPKLIKGESVGGITQNDKIATFVRIHGSYTDHNGNIHDIAYDIYLGQDNTDDFEVMRNQQLDNKLIITGITNHKDAYGGSDTTISIDHRVSMTNKGYTLSMEREAILDAHFEVRPLDIELQPGSTMKIVIPDANDRAWVVMESDASADTNGKYVSNVHRKGVRKYFTTTLVSELNTANGGVITIKHSGKTQQKEIHRIWFYVDENPNVYDKLLDQGKISSSPKGDYEVNDNVNETDKRYRVAKVNFYFAKEGEPDMTTPTTTINFQQWNLWRVWNSKGTRFYDIEHEEEYLNNYASDLQYGNTQDGMEWGLEDLQLSDTDKAFYIQSKSGLNFITRWFSSKAEPYKYDFYISAEESNVIDYNDDDDDGNNSEKIYHPYNGLEFTKKIVKEAIEAINPKTSKPYIDKLRTLVGDPESAVEYCYNKNKRNPTNNEITDIKWYLPSVDEIEDITVGAYDEFDQVFQNKLYWSSQPAYIQKAWHGTFFILITLEYDGYLYIDNKEYARSTKVLFNGTTFVPASSGMSNTNITVNLGDLAWGDGTATESKNNNVPVYGEGYKARTESCRIRAVYRSGTKQ